MSNAIILLNKTEDNLEARDTILIAENTSTKDNNILFPDINLNYDTGDIDDNLNTERTIKEKQDQYIITSTDTINTAVTSEFTDYFLNYKKTDNSVTWVGNRATGTLTNVEANSRKVIPIEDFNTNVQMGISGRNYKDDKDETNYHTWVSLHACVSDIGLHQASWNTNEEYIYHNSNPTLLTDKVLKVQFSDSDDDNTDLRFTISYLTINEDKIKVSTNIKVESETCVKTTDTETNGVSGTSGNLECYKIISVEITKYGSNTINKGNIEFYFETNIDTNSDEGGIIKLEIDEMDNNNQFQYNCNYLNCEYINNFYNKSILSRASGSPVEFTTTGATAGAIYDLIKNHYDTNIGNFDTDMYGSGSEVILELEGGEGRKCEIKMVNDKKFYINNPGYLYKENDLLRFKDPRIRNTVIFKVTGVGDANETSTKFIQEVIARGHSKSNTIKYSLGKKESMVIKDLTISGGVKSDIIVRLIHIKDIFSTKPIQYTLKEFYFYERLSIHEIHNLNLFIDKSDNGNEIFIDLQKIVKDSNDKDEKNTLNFSLNCIKYTT
jgi:hypothetical protein